MHPNLVIAGAPESGTTSLFKWLQARPSRCYFEGQGDVLPY